MTPADRPMNLLFLGNSFTMVADVAIKVAQIAEAAGHPRPVVVFDLAGGRTLAHHIERHTTEPQENIAHPSLPAGATWDYVVLQGHSAEPTRVCDPPAFLRDAQTLFGLVRDHVNGAGVRPVLFQTWAREPSHDYYPQHFSDPYEMQRDLRASYAAAQLALGAMARSGEALLAPVGDAFEREAFDLALYDADLYHSNLAGGLLAGLIIYLTIYRGEVSTMPYTTVSAWAGVDQSMWHRLTQLADAVTQAPGPAQAVADQRTAQS